MMTNGESAKATNPEDLKIAAYHEAGHAVIMRLLTKDPVQKVSIIGSTIGAVGITFRGDNEERLLVPVEVIRARIIAAYGGRAAPDINTAKNISKSLYEEAIKFLGEHRGSLEQVAQALLNKETIVEEELEVLLYKK